MVKGIDISNNNGNVDMAKVKSSGIEYVYVKATEGATFKDKYMETFYKDCKLNNLKVGAYHFLVGTSTPESQAESFYLKIKDLDWDLVPMLDVETNFSGISDYVTRFIQAFKKLSPLQIGIYSYTSFISTLSGISSCIQNLPFWEANYNNKPWVLPTNFFTKRVGHQYTEKGSIPGVPTNCDVNEFTTGVLITNTEVKGSWLQDSETKRWWYKHSDGSYTKDGWEKINDKWYLFDGEGWMIYDWRKDGNNWYYLGDNSDGTMKTGWRLIDNTWYYFNGDGQMQTGWIKYRGDWYYLDKGGVMKTGWIVDGGKDYYLYSNGVMAHDCQLYGYKFDSKGVATKM